MGPTSANHRRQQKKPETTNQASWRQYRGCCWTLSGAAGWAAGMGRPSSSHGAAAVTAVTTETAGRRLGHPADGAVPSTPAAVAAGALS